MTERRNAEQERDRLFELSLDMLCIAGVDGYFKRLNPSFERILGYSRDELLSDSFLDFVHPDDRTSTLEELKKLSQGTPTLYFENRYRCKDGSFRWFGWTATPVPNEGVIYAIARDITALKETQQQRDQLLQHEQTTRSEIEVARNRVTNILESITNAFFALDQSWNFTYVNAQAEHLLQRRRDHLLGQNVWEQFPEAVGTRFYQEYHRAIAHQTSVEFEAFFQPLNTWFEVHAYPSESGLSVFFQDVNERKRVEDELQRQIVRSRLFSEISLRIRQSLQIDDILSTSVREVQKILQSDRVLIFRLEATGIGRVVKESVAPGFSSVLNLEVTDDCFGPDYLQKYRQGRVYMLSDVSETAVEPCLIRFMEKINVKSKLVMPILVKHDFWGLLIAHQCSTVRHWLDFEVSLMQQLADQIGIALAQAQLLEQETLQRQELARSNADLQQFAYVASHDLQEPLRMITSYLQLIERRYKDQLDDDANDFIDFAVEGATRMQTLINDLLSYSRVGTRGKSFEQTDVGTCLKRALVNLKMAIDENNATITYDEMPQIMADETQFTQLFQNLISNAIKFRGAHPPRIHIQAQRRHDDWLFSVQDNGIGIEPQYAQRIFMIFQRLHARNEYPGTGIGLAICKKIVERHNGHIWVESELGKGTTFFFTMSDREDPSS
ncbi:MAG: PAS domain-containing sensor histidine kinase [Elainellaceae cyanobacterium]